MQRKIEDELSSETTEGTTPELDFNKYKTVFQTVMDDDFNTSQAVAVIFDFVKDVNKVISENTKINSVFYSEVKNFLQATAEGVLGIMDFTQKEESDMATKEKELIELLIKLRQNAKEEKNYSLADKIRDELKAIGVVLEDSKDKTTYKVTVN